MGGIIPRHRRGSRIHLTYPVDLDFGVEEVEVSEGFPRLFLRSNRDGVVGVEDRHRRCCCRLCRGGVAVVVVPALLFLRFGPFFW